MGNRKLGHVAFSWFSEANICRERGNNTQLFKNLENWKFEFPPLEIWAREFTENPWQHIKLSHLSLQTCFFILRHLGTTTTSFWIFNTKYLIQYWAGSFRDLTSSWNFLDGSVDFVQFCTKRLFLPLSFPPHQNFKLFFF